LFGGKKIKRLVGRTGKEHNCSKKLNASQEKARVQKGKAAVQEMTNWLRLRKKIGYQTATMNGGKRQEGTGGQI